MILVTHLQVTLTSLSLTTHICLVEVCHYCPQWSSASWIDVGEERENQSIESESGWAAKIIRDKEKKKKKPRNNKSNWLAIKIIGFQFYLTLHPIAIAVHRWSSNWNGWGRGLRRGFGWLLQSQPNVGSRNYCCRCSLHALAALQCSGEEGKFV